MGHPFYTHSGGRLRDEPHSSSIAYMDGLPIFQILQIVVERQFTMNQPQQKIQVGSMKNACVLCLGYPWKRNVY